MKSLTILLALLKDASLSTGANVTRDALTIASRLEHEGNSFLSISLPNFASQIINGLESGVLSTSIYSSFRRKKKAGRRLAVPCFLHGLVSRVFDEVTGNVREDACVISINFLWKIGNLFKKEKLICSDDRVEKAIHSYVDTDLGLRRQVLPSSSSFDFISRRVVDELQAHYPGSNSFVEDCFPKHGPGATADGLRGNLKFTSRSWYSRWDGVFSWEELYGFSTIHQAHSRSVSPRDELPVKVVTVPKTQKSPRIISIEPTAMQFAQQLVSARLVYAIDNSSFRKQIDISNQSTNARLAKEGSKDGSWATIDLSEASDRISCKLVRNTFSRSSKIRQQLFATRSSRAVLPDGTQLTLAKFASMGSACTFPVETLVFYIIAVSAIVDWRWDSVVSRKGDPAGLNCRSMRSICETSLRLAFVYGDDIIVPTDSFSHVTSKLEANGLKVNLGKSFSQGSFRESCGTDAFKGYEITPLYVRTVPPVTKSDGQEIVSWIALANNAYKHGLWSVATCVREYLESILAFRVPYVRETSPGLGWYSFRGTYEVNSWRRDTQSPLVRTLKIRRTRESSKIADYDALLKFQIRLPNRSDQVSTSPDHLDFVDRRYSINTRLTKVQPY